jgi:glycine dehydrogenase subunit 2
MSDIFEFEGIMGMGYSQPDLIIERSKIKLPPTLKRKELPRLPLLSEPEVVRHYTWLSTRNFGIDTGFYPLGSCTMKHNPRVNEVIAAMPGITELHPLQKESHQQGLFAIMFEMQEMLGICAGMDSVSLQPVAGAQGEFTAIRCIQEYHKSIGEGRRNKVIVPDSAHGTNPASAAMCGYEIIEIPSAEDGLLDLDALKAVVGEDTAAMMITNPNTLGIFEPEISKAAEIVHSAGGQMYYDGANFNAILGKTTPGLMGFDAVHYNLHKTFSQPHGGGGPGSGPIGVKEHLAKFLPSPLIVRREISEEECLDGLEGVDSDNLSEYGWWHQLYEPEESIGKVQQWMGNSGAIVRSWAFYRRYGFQLEKMSEHAVLNANYLHYKIMNPNSEISAKIPVMPVDGSKAKFCKHEFTISATPLKDSSGITAMDLAKGLLDKGYMAPTVYFPLVVPECLMIEPTETESKNTLDTFASKFHEVLTQDYETLHKAPITTHVGRVDEVQAARNLVLKYEFEN